MRECLVRWAALQHRSVGRTAGMGRSCRSTARAECGPSLRYALRSATPDRVSFRCACANGRLRNSIIGRCCHRAFGEARRKKATAFACDSSNVDMALTQNAQAKARLFRSGSIYLFYLYFLVAEVGFEPVTFRL
jgi:hypothetical protein